MLEKIRLSLNEVVDFQFINLSKLDPTILGIGLFFVYLITARIGLSIHPVNTFATLVWPPTGVALAALVLYGYGLWPAIALGAFIVNMSIGASFPVAVGIALGNTLEAVLGAYLLKRYVGYNPSVLRLRDNLGIGIIGPIIAVVAATFGVISLFLGGTLSLNALGTTWSAWWVGDMLGALVLTPVLIKWLSPALYLRTRGQFIELCFISLTVTVTSFLVFWTQNSHFEYLLFIPLSWAALRTGPRGTTLSVLIASCVAITGTILGDGPFAHAGLYSLQFFLATLAFMFLVFVAIVEERRQAQEALKQHVHELETALQKISSEDEARKEFIAVLAHELRNPLASILSSVELLKYQGANAADAGAILQTIEERVRITSGLLNDLLDISRIVQKKLILDKQLIPLNASLDRAISAVSPLIHAYGHTLSVTKANFELYLEADPIRLEQIIVNLLSNAAKYTEAQGVIELITTQKGNEAAIHIRDSGIGIARSMLEHIFEPFFQVAHGKKKMEGLGIGLSITKQLVEMHGGRIEAMSLGEGHGSEFIVYLPLSQHREAPLPPQKNAVSKNRVLRPTKYPHKILIVDDNETAANSLGSLLKLRGHTVALAYTGIEASKKALTFHPDIIILDIGLPDIDGYEVARALRRRHLSAFLIALSGYGQDQDKQKAFEAGFHYHLTKPVGLREIEIVLRKAHQEISKKSNITHKLVLPTSKVARKP